MSKSSKRKPKAKRKQLDPRTMRVTRDISTLPQHLYDYAIGMMTAFGYFSFDDSSKTLSIATDADSTVLQFLRTEHFVMPMRLSFNVAVECLLKAVLLKNEIPIIQNSRASKTAAKLNKAAANYADAKAVCDFIADWGVYADSWKWAHKQLAQKNIVHMFDVSTGTLGALIPRTRQPIAKRVLTVEQYGGIRNALLVFTAIRRNVDAHTFFGIEIAGHIQYDLPNLYVPLVNALIAAYWR